MAHDPDALFPSGPTTRRGLLSAFSRRAVEALPVPAAGTPAGAAGDPLHEALADSLEYAIWKSGAELRRRDERHFTTGPASDVPADGPATATRR